MVIHDFNGVEWVKRQFGEQSIIAESITAAHIKSLAGLNVNDQFVVDANGNVSFAGHLEGASGTFSGSVATNKDMNIGKRLYIEYEPGQESGIYFEESGGNVYSYIKREDGGQVVFFNDENNFRFDSGLEVYSSLSVESI